MIKLLLPLLLLVCHLSMAQRVTVRDRTTLEPLPGVTISSENSSAQTDASGQAELRALLSPKAKLRFHYIGYQSKSFTAAQLQQQQYEVSLTQQSHGLQEVVVSAGKFAQERNFVPQQVALISQRELEFMSQPTTAEVLQQTGKVLVQKSQMGGGSPILRGFEANKVLLVVDGVRMNNAIYRGGHLQNVITLDNSMLERAEVIFGPSSVIYGSDALGGVLHFHTLQPQLAPDTLARSISGSAFTRYASAPNEKTGHVQLNYGRQKWASLTSITVSDFGNLRQGRYRSSTYGDLGIRNFYAARTAAGRDTMLLNPEPHVQRPTGYTQYDLLQKIRFQPTSSLSHTLNLQLSTSTDVPRYDRLTEFSSDRLKYGAWYYGPQERLLAAYTLEQKAPASLYDEARAIAAVQRLEESRHNRRFGNNWLSHQTEQVWVYSLNADFSKKLRTHRLQYGLEANYNSVQSEADEQNIMSSERRLQSTRYPDEGSSMHSAAGYLTNTWDVRPWLVLSQGIRYSYVGLDARFEDKTFFPFLEDKVQQRHHALSGNLGAVVLPGNGWRFAALASTGFRAPNIDDLSKVFDSSPGNVIVPNPGLGPEYTYNFEVSASKSIAERLHLEVVGYRTWYRDAITVQNFSLNGQDSILYNGEQSRVTANVNAGKAYLYGYSANLQADLTNYLSLSSSLNYTYGRIKNETGEIPLDHVPPLFGRSSINLQLKRLRGEFFVLYHGVKALEDYSPSGEDNLQYATPQGMPAWHTLNLRAAYQITPNLQFQAALENISDRYYRVFASGISAPGRNVVLTLRGEF
ncbi:TonB-dependent receptor [Pontibacter akesuensis]|uniref:Hemoglobin/transferrin/lactoferrin receptor protein n=1 Tax=Pontibacter akesuensis TaxID=388950 RepID=A0A1I7J2G5_9BACT|nr:TonB-dependent receptor [Pontibacter akesuensis]SFU79385.1 hemoglobin/transferrin/lactoferrin receptor protein [Pontibacter akesuensis]